MPYLSGVTRVVGREGIEPPVSEDGWSTASCAPWRDRPIRGPVWRPALDDASAVVKVLVSRLAVGRVEAGSEGVEPPVAGFGDRDTAVARAQGARARMTKCASAVKRWKSARKCCAYCQRTTGLPVLAESRRPGCNSLWSRDPGRHAYAPKLDRAWPWSVRSAVKVRAIGRKMLRLIAGSVNGISARPAPRYFRPTLNSTATR